MTDNTQPEALRLATASNAMADEGVMIHLLSWHEIRNLLRANVAELRRQHAELETLRAKIKTYEDLVGAADDVQLLRMGYAAARLEIDSLRKEHADELAVAYMCGASRGKELAAQQPGAAAWMPLPDTLPEPGKAVLLDIGKKYPIRAMWVQKFTLPVGMEDDSGFGEYDEATDTYYCPEGWYEWNQNEETHWAVSETPRAWCELPLKDTQ